MQNFLAISWSISNRYGWGIYGLNLALELIKRGQPLPVCLENITTDQMPLDVAENLQPLIDFQEQNLKHMHRVGQVASLKNTVVLHALGNDMEWGLLSHSFEGDANVGVVFFEDTNVSPEGMARVSKLDCMIAGSTWNGQVLEQLGAKKVKTVFQGVDVHLFRPLPKKGVYEDKFTIFSGGKLDFRKSQDIVLEAFKIFSSRHDDALLVTAWHNLWPHTALGFLHSPYIEFLPKVDAQGRIKIAQWAAEFGIAPDKFVDLGMVPNDQMPHHLKEMDLAVFPNRCEGGTNLVAMETMACGVPSIIAANTGQLDLANEDHCFVLPSEGGVEIPHCGTDGWGEVSVEELVEKMEHAYQNRNESRELGLAGSDFMHEWTWQNQISKLLDAIDEF
jgi:glycosyltransferase involved in cell wall biosynthesis